MKVMKKTAALALACALSFSLISVQPAQAAAKIKMSAKKASLAVGQKKQLKLKKGKKAIVKGVKWSSSKKKVATVTKKGKVTAKKAGTTVIKAKYKKKTYKCKVTVKAATTNNTTNNSNSNSSSNNNSSNNNSSNNNSSSNSSSSGSTTTEEDTNVEVKWTVSEETYAGSFAYEEGEDTKTENIKLKRKYVSFNPWPTTNAMVQYVIKNCDDPYVIGALYVVALDNMEKPSGISDYTNKVFDMLNSLQTGAGVISGSSYLLSNYAKQHINEYYSKQCVNTNGNAVYVKDFASRTFLKGATPYNGYTPESGDLKDKTTWKIIVDQYPYCCEQAEDYSYVYNNPKWFTVCPRRYTEYQDTEGGELEVVEHSQALRIGFRWNSKNKCYLPTDYASINSDPGSAELTPYNIQASILFSNNYKAPQEDQGW